MEKKIVLLYLKKISQLVSLKPWKTNIVSDSKIVHKFHEDHAQTYSEESLKSLNHYGKIGFSEINRHLRGERILNQEDVKDIERHIENIDEAMNRSPLKSDVIVWRGLNTNFMAIKRHPLLKKLYQIKAIKMDLHGSPSATQESMQAMAGFTFTEPNYISTSLNKNAEPTLDQKDVILKIKVPLGTQAVYMNAAHSVTHNHDIEEFEGFPDEHELLLDRGLKYRVLSALLLEKPLRGSRGKIQLNLEVID